MSPTALAFLAAFLAGCMLSVQRHPIFGLMTYVGVIYIEPGAQWWGQGFFQSVRWVLLAAGVTLVSLLIHKPAGPVLPLGRSGAFVGFVVFVFWIVVQSMWALDSRSHAELRTIWINFLLVAYMFARCIDSERHLRYILWTHVLGCFFLGLTAWVSYEGGRFEGFGASGLAEANAGALQLVTGVIVAGALFLEGNLRVKAVLLLSIPFIVNGMVTTVSRSGFLAAAFGGLVFNLLTPAKYRLRVFVFSILAAVLFVMITNPEYWTRMDTIKDRGADIEGVDTGGGRLEIIQAQWQMFKGHLFGCGHMCTTELSPRFIDAKWLTREGGRASHNTFMTMLVDHGIVGGALYLAMLIWMVRSVRKLAARLRGRTDLFAMALPAVGGVLAAITVGDLFVQYPKLEVRIWFISLLMVMLHLTEQKQEQPALARAKIGVAGRGAVD